MRHDLKVPFAEKDEAKKLGARWDAARKRWYIQDHLDVALFSRWQPTPHEASVKAPASPKLAAATQQTSSTRPEVGSRYVALPKVCDCLPWDDCEKCQSQTLTH